MFYTVARRRPSHVSLHESAHRIAAGIPESCRAPNLPCKRPLRVDAVFGMETVLFMSFRRSLGLLFAVILGSTGKLPAGEAGGLLIRYHFAGLDAATGNPELARLRDLMALPESQRILRDVNRKLTMSLPTWFGGDALTSNEAASLQQAFRPLLQKESFIEVRRDGERVSAWALASRLEPPQATVLRSAITRMLAGALRADAPADDATEWEAPGRNGRSGPRVVTSGGWVILGAGAGVVDDFRKKVSEGTAPFTVGTNEILGAEADLPRLAKLLNWPEAPAGPFKEWPQLRVVAEPRSGALRTTGSLVFAHDLEISSEPWKVPASVMRDPIVAFTAIRNADVWLSRVPWLARIGLAEWPRQLFLWSIAGFPWEQYFAAPMNGASQVLPRIATPLATHFVENSVFKGEPFSVRITNQAHRAELRGRFPFFSPYLEVREEQGQDIMVGGLFPARKGELAPAELLSQVQGRTNLVLYDWETSMRIITTNPPGRPGPRLETNLFGRPLALMQLAQVCTPPKASLSQIPVIRTGEVYVPGLEWMKSAVGFLGTTITEVTQKSPNQLELLRNSQVGFNSLELMLLFSWLENPGFPRWEEVPIPAPRQPPATAPKPSPAKP